MEEDAARLLVKIVKTISIVIVWMIITMTFGIYFGWFFYYKTPTLGNIICYVFNAATLVLVLLYLRRLWKEEISSQ
jgi:hypothetical protein